MSEPIPPESVEGSEARRLDRGRDMLFGDSLEAEQSLGDPEVVEEALRGFAGRVTALRGAYHSDTLTGPQVTEAIHALAKEYAAIFLGGNSAYTPLPWNSPGKLGLSLRLRKGWLCPNDEAVEIRFIELAAQLVDDMVAYEEDRMSDQGAQTAIAIAIEDAKTELLGLPHPVD